ncbi:universal stress protein [Halovivax sp.]|uniref:universal stress protein n=1 Tax=Halovivax sp. TaxID=1935978 RepID=UPI0025C4464D|nr:universal stress protein [Halovivax sp.]
MTDRVLVPFDDSEPARTALEEACSLFSDAELVVLHVLDASDAGSAIDGAGTEDLQVAEDELAEGLFADAHEIAAECGRTIETRVVRGQPAREIRRFAVDRDVDHVVMGSHGRSGLSRILVGSVAEEVIRNSPVSVTIARGTT